MMNTLNHKIDFVAFFAVTKANGNGDPLNGNRPRTDYDGFGELSDVCIKRKIRNRMQDMGKAIFVQSEDRCDDGCASLSDRAGKAMDKIKDRDTYADMACEKWLDVRSFGQVFAFKSTEKGGVSVGVRGPVSIHQAVSVDPVEIETMQITKSVNSETSEKRGPDTMGQKHCVKFGLYKCCGSVNVQLAKKTGFSKDDAAVLKECLRTMFVNDVSSARPDGSMEVVRLYWFDHANEIGQFSSAKVYRSVNAVLKSGCELPHCVEDYTFTVENLDGLEPEVMEGL